MSVQLGTKQPSLHGEGGSNAQEHRDAKHEKLPIQKGLEVQLISQLSLKEKNVVWLNPKDFSELFSDTEEDASYYVQIAGQVFHAAVAQLNPGHIGMTEVQIESVGDGIYSCVGGRGISISPFFIQDYIPYPIKKLEIEIEDEKGHYNEDYQRVLPLDEIKRQVRNILQEEVISRNKKLVLNLPGGPLKVSVNAIYPAKGFQDTSSPVGMILPDTELDIVHRLSSHVVVVDKVYREEVERMDYYVSISKRSESADRNTLPLPISQDEIQRLIQKKYGNHIVAPGAQFVIHHKSGWDITVTFKGGTLKENDETENEVRLVDYKQGFVLDKQTPLRITHHRDILLTEGDPRPATQITFKIADMPGQQTVAIDHNKERWIDLEELKQAINALNRPFATRETFEVSLSSGKYLIEVRKAQGDGEAHKGKDTEALWTITSDTTINIIAEKELAVNLLRDGTVHPIK